MRFPFYPRKTVPDVRSWRLRRSQHVLATSQGEEVVLFDTRGERYFTLNEVGARVWALLAEPTSLGEIVQTIRREFDVPREAEGDPVERDVAALLQDLLGAGLLEAKPWPRVRA